MFYFLKNQLDDRYKKKRSRNQIDDMVIFLGRAVKTKRLGFASGGKGMDHRQACTRVSPSRTMSCLMQAIVHGTDDISVFWARIHGNLETA